MERPLCHPLSPLCSTPGSLTMEASPSRVRMLLARGLCSQPSAALSHEDLPQSSWVLRQCSRERALPCGGLHWHDGRRRGSGTGEESGKSWSQEAGRAGGGVLGCAAALRWVHGTHRPCPLLLRKPPCRPVRVQDNPPNSLSQLKDPPGMPGRECEAASLTENTACCGSGPPLAKGLSPLLLTPPKGQF